MKLDSETLEFVRAGLDRYPGARDTVRFFEETILQAIGDALAQRPWRTFRPATLGAGKLAISKTKREYNGIPFLQVGLEGLGRAQEQKVRIVAGIYWDNPVVAEVSLWDPKWKRLPMKPPASLAAGIWFNPSEPGLNLHVGKEFEPEADFKRLLDALEDAMESDA